LRLVEAGRLALWHSPEDRPYATVATGDHVDHLRVDDIAFKRWLSFEFFRVYGHVIPDNALKQAVNTLAGRALFTAPTFQTHTRVAAHGDAIYLDLADDERRAVRIDAHGWAVIESSEVPEQIKFRRTSRMLPLPIPVPGGNLAELRGFVNCE